MSTEKLVLGRYRVLERIGRGAMGVIYRGVDPVLDREVAIKVMSADFADQGPDAKRRFFREARAAARLQHRNIVTVFEFAEEDGVPYIVMEFLRGKSLAARIGADPPLAPGRKLDILAELCDGLQYAGENGVIHRDVKPANVWLLEDGSVKLVDFGIAKITTGTSTVGRDVIGSAAYMSPEQAEGRVVDARTDIFSAAVVLYELIAGRRPWEASTPTATLLKIVQEPPPPIAETAPDVPAALVAVIERALEKNPANRYQTAGEFGAELRFIRTTLMAGSDTGLLSDPALASTSTTRTADPSPATPTAGRPARTGREAGLPAHARWGRLLVAGVIGGLVMTGVLYWSKVSWIGVDPFTKPPSTVAPGDTKQDSGGPSSLKITSEPEDAAIFVDGTDTGLRTPAEISITAGVPKAIRLTKKGFQTLDSPLANTDVRRGLATFQLKPEVLTIRVQATGSYPFEILIENRVISAMAREHNDVPVQVGQQVRLRAPDQFLDDRVVIDAVRRTIRAPELGDVRFTGREECAVLFDGKELGYPLFTTRAAAGFRRFDFRCNSGQPLASRRVEVKAGEMTRVPLQ